MSRGKKYYHMSNRSHAILSLKWFLSVHKAPQFRIAACPCQSLGPGHAKSRSQAVLQSSPATLVFASTKALKATHGSEVTKFYQHLAFLII